VDVDPDAYVDGLPSRGDIVVLRLPEYDQIDFIKRVIGLPGDVVEERDGIMYVNGSPVDIPQPPGQPDSRTLGPWNVEGGHLFVVGDNMVDSNDSRFGLGQIAFADVVGKVVGVNTGTGPSPLPPPPAASTSLPSPSPS